VPNWNDILNSFGSTESPLDSMRRNYLEQLHKHTGRNILVYYCGWLQKDTNPRDAAINDADMTGFMTCSNKLDRSKGLDLILHTPGGDIAATESIINYLHSLYNGDIRAIVPQLAMSGGTLMSISCKEIVMGKQSSLGPVDPQISGMPAHGVLEEFDRAISDVTANPNAASLWQPIIQKYWPTLITSCKHAIDWSGDLLEQYLSECMFKDCDQAVRVSKIDKISESLGKQSTSKSHARHINAEKAKSLGLKIIDLEDDPILQDLVLSLHHALTITFTQTNAVKIIENHLRVSYVNNRT
jgi:membrane-bound ClpP family serine protease